MAYRRAPNRKRSYASRRPATARRTARRSAAPRRSRSSRVSAQTLRIVIEQVPGSAVSRPAGPFVAAAAPKPKKAKF